MDDKDEYRLTICIEKTARCRSQEEAEQLARKIAAAEIENNAGMDRFELQGSMAERV